MLDKFRFLLLGLCQTYLEDRVGETESNCGVYGVMHWVRALTAADCDQGERFCKLHSESIRAVVRGLLEKSLVTGRRRKNLFLTWWLSWSRTSPEIALSTMLICWQNSTSSCPSLLLGHQGARNTIVHTSYNCGIGIIYAECVAPCIGMTDSFLSPHGPSGDFSMGADLVL